MITHILSLAKRLITENRRDPLFILHIIIGPIAALFITKLVLNSVEELVMIPLPAGAMGIGFLSLIIHFNGYMLCSLVIIRERTTGTIDRIFVSTFKKFEIIMGYLLGYSVVILIQSAVVLVTGAFFFKLPIGSNIFTVLGIIILLGMVSIGMAMAISNFCNKESHAMLAIPIILIPSFLLGDLIFPIQALPKGLKILSAFFPLRFAITSLKETILWGKPFLSIYKDVLFLLFYGIIMVILGSLTLKDRR